jgi:hypothetical protein
MIGHISGPPARTISHMIDWYSTNQLAGHDT